MNAFNNVVIFILVMVALLMRSVHTFLENNYGFLFLIIIPVMIFQYIIIRKHPRRKKEVIIRLAIIMMSVFVLICYETTIATLSGLSMRPEDEQMAIEATEL